MEKDENNSSSSRLWWFNGHQTLFASVNLKRIVRLNQSTNRKTSRPWSSKASRQSDKKSDRETDRRAGRQRVVWPLGLLAVKQPSTSSEPAVKQASKQASKYRFRQCLMKTIVKDVNEGQKNSDEPTLVKRHRTIEKSQVCHIKSHGRGRCVEVNSPKAAASCQKSSFFYNNNLT